MNSKKLTPKILIIANLLVLALLVCVVILTIGARSRTDGTVRLELPISVPDEYMLSHRVYQEFETSNKGYEIAYHEDFGERVYLSCLEYGIQPESYDSSDETVMIWQGGRSLDEGIRGIQIYCDTSLEKLQSEVVGSGGALEVLFSDGNDRDVGERGIGISDKAEGETLRVFTRGLVSDADENGRDLLLASVPMSIQRENVTLSDGSRISGPKEVYVRVAFWVDAGTFSEETVKDWSEQSYIYGITCLNDGCTYVDKI